MICIDGVKAFVNDYRHDAGQRFGAASGLRRDRPRQRAHHDPAGFGLPPSINDRAFAAANLFVVPDPSFRINAFANSPQQTQAAQVMLVDVLVTPFYERSNGRWSCLLYTSDAADE